LPERLGEVLFRLRSYTPIPLIVIAFLSSDPTIGKIILGSAIVFIGESIRVWSAGYVGGSSRTREVGGDELVTQGPYAYTRNPLYSGNLLLSVGMLICFWGFMPYLVLILLPLFFLQYYSIIRTEEEYLQKRFGAAYTSYKKSVPAFFPQLKGYAGNSASFDLSKGIRSERSTFGTLTVLYVLLIVRCLFLNSTLPLF